MGDDVIVVPRPKEPEPEPVKVPTNEELRDRLADRSAKARKGK